jgi:hypothetical protein
MSPEQACDNWCSGWADGAGKRGVNAELQRDMEYQTGYSIGQIAYATVVAKSRHTRGLVPKSMVLPTLDTPSKKPAPKLFLVPKTKGEHHGIV